MILTSLLFAAVSKRSTIATAFPVDSAPTPLADFWTTPSFDSRADTFDSQNLRSVFDIVWSCLATVFACSWVSVHPNIPSPNDSSSSILKRRIKLMFAAIIVPELIVVWAMRQWASARQIARTFEARGWTQVHGHFLIMGGLMLFDQEGKPTQTISIEKFQELLTEDSIEFPIISEKEILDRSKGDLLSKSIVAVQVAWFALQCIARRLQGLAITELELIALAFTTLNGAIYFFWWNKPLDVQCSFGVPLKKLLPSEMAPSEVNEPRIEEIDIRELIQAKYRPCQGDNEHEPVEMDPVSLGEHHNLRLKVQMCSSIQKPMTSIRHALSTTFEAIVALGQRNGVIGSALLVFIVWPVGLGSGLLELMRPEEMIEEGALQVPMYYTPCNAFGGVKVAISVNSAAALTILFGGIHLTGWSGEFPTQGAQSTWHVASLIITLSPFVMYGFGAYHKIVEWLRGPLGDDEDPPFSVIVYPLLMASVVAYIASRFALFIVGFYCLKSIPPSGLQKVIWTSFIPHVS